MSKRQIELFVIDILVALDVVNRHADKIQTADDLINDEIICSAMMRQLEIIGEAMKYLIQADELKNYVNPHWRKIVDFRNIVAHEYFGINYYQVFDIIKIQIPRLEQEIIDLIKKLPDKDLIFVAIESFIKDLFVMNRLASAKNLQLLKSIIKK